MKLRHNCARIFLAASFFSLFATAVALADDEENSTKGPSTGNTQAGVVTKGVEDIGYRQDWKKQEQANEQMNKEFQEQQNIDQRYVKEAYEDVNKHQNEVNRNETEYNNSKKEYETNRQAEIDAGKKSADAEASASTAEREANKLEKEAANAKKNKDPNAGELENKAKKARENANTKRSEANTAKQNHEKSKIETDKSATKVKESGKKLETSKKELTKSQKKLESRKANSAKKPTVKTKPTFKGTIQKAGNMAGTALTVIQLGADAREVQEAYKSGNKKALRDALLNLGLDITDTMTFGIISNGKNGIQLIIEERGESEDRSNATQRAKDAQAQTIATDIYKDSKENENSANKGMSADEAYDLATKYANGTATPEERERVENAYKNMNNGGGKSVPGLKDVPTETGWSNWGDDIKKTFTSYDHFKGKVGQVREDVGEQVVKTTYFVTDATADTGEVLWTAVTGKDHSGIAEEGKDREDLGRVRLENKLIQKGVDPEKAHDLANRFFENDPEAKKTVHEIAEISKKLRDSEVVSDPDPEGGKPETDPGSNGGLGTFINDTVTDIAKRTGEQFGFNDKTLEDIKNAWQNAQIKQNNNQQVNTAGENMNDTLKNSAVNAADAQDKNSLTTKMADAGEDAVKQGVNNAAMTVANAAAERTRVPGEGRRGGGKKGGRGGESAGPDDDGVDGDPSIAQSGGGKKGGGKKGGGKKGGGKDDEKNIAKNEGTKGNDGNGNNTKSDGHKNTNANKGKMPKNCEKCGVSFDKIPWSPSSEHPYWCSACQNENPANVKYYESGNHQVCDRCTRMCNILIPDSGHKYCPSCESAILREKAGMTSKSGNKTGNGSSDGTVHFCGKCRKACTDGHKDYMGYAFLCSSCSATVTQVNPNASSSSTGSSGSGKVNGTYSSSGGPANRSDTGAFTCNWCGKKSKSVVSGVGSGVYCSNACYQKFLDSRKQGQGTQSNMRELHGDHKSLSPLQYAPDYRGVR